MPHNYQTGASRTAYQTQQSIAAQAAGVQDPVTGLATTGNVTNRSTATGAGSDVAGPGQDGGGNPISVGSSSSATAFAPATGAGVSLEKWMTDNAAWLGIVLAVLGILVTVLVVVLL